MQTEQLALSFLRGVGLITANRILEVFGKAEHFFRAPAEECKAAGFTDKACAELDSLRDEALRQAENQAEECSKRGIWILSKEDDSYPDALKICDDAPLVLYGIGNPNIRLQKGVAVVGTRHASYYGKSQTRKIVEGLAACTDGVISGMALGIDAEAHRAALDCGLYTVAVMGPGLDQLYPPENLDLAQRILDSGGSIISEMPVNTIVSPGLFPRRNRIVAGMAVATIMTEGAIKSGAVITAKLAESYQRTVFAVPGRNDMHFQEGCNWLIACGKALLVRHADDIKRGLGWEYADAGSGGGSTSAGGGSASTGGGSASAGGGSASAKRNAWVKDPEQAEIMRILEIENPAPWDLLLLQSNQDIQQLSATLLKMEIAGVVRSLPGNFYEKN